MDTNDLKELRKKRIELEQEIKLKKDIEAEKKKIKELTPKGFLSEFIDNSIKFFKKL